MESTTTRTLKNEPGDWVAIPAVNAPGGYSVGKVVDADRETVTVETRTLGTPQRRTYDAPLRRIRWTRQRGRRAWVFV